MAENYTILMVPGLGGSDAGHWQSLWQADEKQIEGVTQEDWDHPDVQAWTSVLQLALEGIKGPVILVAHSLGCVLVANWAAHHGNSDVVGAMLVAPSDVEDATRVPAVVLPFAPIPDQKLPFASIVVASRNDPYVAIERAACFADNWGAEFVDIGNCGHINTDANIGGWPRGRALLMDLIKRQQKMHKRVVA